MFKTLIILYARSFFETESRPNPGRSFPHWLATMVGYPMIIAQNIGLGLAWRVNFPAGVLVSDSPGHLGRDSELDHLARLNP
jgi:hypothetical protein